MNQVSWMIYLAGICENFGGLLIFLGIAVEAIAIVYLCMSIYHYQAVDIRYADEDTRMATTKEARRIRRFVPLLICVSFALWISAALLPGQNTVLAIAAREMGEQMLKTPLANKAEHALEAWLDRQITPAKAVN